MSDATERLAKSIEDRKTHLGLRKVPLRGTTEWTERERLRLRLGNRCLSFGPIGTDAFNGYRVGWRIKYERDAM